MKTIQAWKRIQCREIRKPHRVLNRITTNSLPGAVETIIHNQQFLDLFRSIAETETILAVAQLGYIYLRTLKKKNFTKY